ncbi:MAG: endonuclease/exonuclease/phosphatase family protein [Blastocatellia bacterium]
MKISTNNLQTGNRFLAACFLIGCAFIASATAQKELSIAAIQGEGNLSPVDGQSVRITGIVTSRIKTGFFIQSPDDKADGDPNTSEGIYIFTRNEPDAGAVAGNLVSVTGKVEEFRRNNEPANLTVTEISFQKDRDEVRVISTGNVLPKPVALKSDDFKSNSIDQLERYEGMRVLIGQLVVVGPTDGKVDVPNGSSESTGAFYGVLKGIPRPFREAGLEINDYLFLDEKGKEKFKTAFPKLPFYDTNPERLRIESAAQNGNRPIDVTTTSELSNLTGVLHFTFRSNTIIVDSTYKPAITGTIKPNPLPAPNDRQFSVAGMNIENFFDDRDDPSIKEDVVSPEAFQKRLKKISYAIRDAMKLPDVIGIVEAESLYGLKKLAERINSDMVASGKPDPKYQAYLTNGNDGRGIDNGFLVKSSRVKVAEIKQFGKDERYKNPNSGEDNFLNDRPPLMLKASIIDPKSGLPFEVTVVVNHLKSYLGYSDPRQQDNVRLKKRLQAEFLAKWVQSRQTANSKERIILLGDFNSYQFSDGVLDMIGTIKGNPAAKGEVLNPSEDLVNPDMINLVDVIDKKQRYSYTYDGNAQTLDHILITDNLQKNIKAFGFVRVNADFPEVYRNDGSRPERFSDHDPAIAYFSLD